MKVSKCVTLLWACLFLSACQTTGDAGKSQGAVTDQTFGHYAENLEPNLILITLTTDYYALLTQNEAVPVNGDVPAPYAKFIDTLESRYTLKRVANWPLQTIDVFCVVFEINNSEERQRVIAALSSEEGVETAQLVQSFAIQSEPYNDPYLSLQHGFHSMEAINSHQWSRGKGVRVAVIDTGLDTHHSEISSSTESMKNFVDGDEISFRSDVHGTAVGGVIAADSNNDTGMVGIAPDAMLLALKACWHIDEQKNTAICNSLTLAKALNYSIQQGVDIINLSLTGPPDPILERLVLQALAQGIVVIGAKPVHDNKAFPTSISGTIVADMPNTDRTQTIKAPGRRVLSLLPNEQYDFFNGSSFSTAHVTGLTALVLGISPALLPADIQMLLEQTANVETGEINACKAVEWARKHADNSLSDSDCL